MRQREYKTESGAGSEGLLAVGNWERLNRMGRDHHTELNLLGGCNSLIQRFTQGADGRLSKNHTAFVSNEGNLYARADKVDEGNQALAAAPVKLEAGEGNLHELPAVKVSADVKEALLPEQALPEPAAVASIKEDCLAYNAVIAVGLTDLGANRDKDSLTALLAHLIDGFKDREESFKERSENLKYALLEEKDKLGDGVTEAEAEALLGKIRRLSVYLNQAAVSDKLFLPSDCGLFAGLMMGIPDKEQEDEDGDTYTIGLQKPDERVRHLTHPVPGGSYYVTGELSGEQLVAYHWGLVIMNDDSDTVTMEGAVAPATEFPKLDMDHTWRFAMQGGLEGFKADNKHYFKDETVTQSGIYQKKQMEVAESEIIQRVYHYNPQWDRIGYAPFPDEVFQSQGYVSVEGNEYKVWSPPDYAVHVRNMLKIQGYREETEGPPSVIDRMNPSDARGVGKMAAWILGTYPPDRYGYLFPGASGDMIAAFLRMGYGTPVFQFALSNMKMDMLVKPEDKERVYQYISNSLNPLLTQDKDILIADAVSTGASLQILKQCVEELDQSAGRKRNIVMLALNEVKGTAEEEALAQVKDITHIPSEGDQDIEFVKRRIYKQNYKEQIPRTYPKVPMEDVASGKITSQPQADPNAVETQNLEAWAMIKALTLGSKSKTMHNRELRSIISYANVSAVSAKQYLKDKEKPDFFLNRILDEHNDLTDIVRAHRMELIHMIYEKKAEEDTVLLFLQEQKKKDDELRMEQEIIPLVLKKFDAGPEEYEEFCSKKDDIIALVCQYRENTDIADALFIWLENKKSLEAMEAALKKEKEDEDEFEWDDAENWV